MRKILSLGFVLVIVFTLLSCASSTTQSVGEPPVIKYDYKPKEITELCNAQMKRTDAQVAEILKIPPAQKNFDNTILALENALSDLSENTTPATFMNYVSRDKGLRGEAEQCESALGQYGVGLTSRRDVYDAFVEADKNTDHKTLDVAQKRLIEETVKAFRKNGLFLPDDQLKLVKELRQKMTALETQFSSNLNEVIDFIEVTKAETDGLPTAMLERLEKLPNGNYKVTVKASDYMQFMENAKSSEARKRLAEKWDNRAAEKNTKIFQEVLGLRRQVAKLLKFKNWADYKIEDHMAKDSKTVNDFLEGLRSKLEKKNKEDQAHLLKLKKEMEPGSTKLEAWDGTYYANQLKKKDYSVDDEAVREYFPSDRTVLKMFDIYAMLLNVKFVEVPNAKTWSPDVKLYEIHDAKTGDFIANFFTDFIPREGKYGHAAAFTLRSGRIVNGKYRTPISAIVANFNPPSNGRPSLLSHGEVETLFHEFGHIMHQTLTKAPFASLSGTSVAQDFVEAPSQMLENWVWDPKILKMISGHYKDMSKTLPEDLMKQLIKTRDFNKGYFYTRQLLFGIFDMSVHTATGDIDATETYKSLYRKLVGIEPLKDSHFPATFGHLMGGYDAGYYGYLWSEVFAEDMFTQFEKAGLTNGEVGHRYREDILEQGDVYPASQLLEKFLKRKPNNKAFFNRLGIGG